MLHIWMGADRITLSDQLLGQVCAAGDRKDFEKVLIVPDQFTYETQRRLCAVGGDTISRHAEVLAFSQLADRVAAVHGGIAGNYLDHGGRLLAMAMAAEQISSRIKYFAAVIRKPEFLAQMVSIVDEFRSYCLQPTALMEAASRTEGQFAQKLEELGLLYEAYLAVCANGKADPTEKLLLLRETLVETDWAEKRVFFVDGFSDFTGAEKEVLEILLRQSDHVWVALCAEKNQPMTAPAQDTARSLQRMAEKWSIPVEIISVADTCKRDASVSYLLQELFSSGSAAPQSSDRISLRVFSSVEEECRCAVLQVKKLLERGLRCRDVSLACADLHSYEAPLRSALRDADLPYYIAGNDDILSKPRINAVLSALMASVGPMDYEDVALYLKSGLPMLEQEYCDRLDCYAYLWNLRGSQWEHPWELHPRGFGEVWSDDDRRQLEQLNIHKEAALAPLFRLRNGLLLAKNTGEMVLTLYDFLEELQLRQRLEDQANEEGGQIGQELFQLYDIIRQCLEQMWMMVGSTVRTPDDFAKLFKSVLTQYHVGTIPAGVDQIYVGALEDMRQRRTKHLLVLGAADGSFPSYKTGDGLLTEGERKQLVSQGLSLSPPRADQMEQELCKIYTALSSAMDSIWLSYAGDQPAWLYRRAAALFPASVQTEQMEVFLNVPSFAAWRLRHGDDTLVSVPQLEQWERNLRALRSYDFQPLSKETVQGLYGKQLYLSASRIDKFAACRFAFFLAYGLKAAPRKQAKLDPSAFGTFVHAVLEQTVLRVKAEGGFQTVSQQRLLEIALEEIERYADEHFPQQAQRAAYLFNRSKGEILDIVLDLGEELRNSLFQPADCELEFSEGGQLPAFEVRGDDVVCHVSGFVDRVDLYEADGKAYVRVVDYKTGHKDFDYTDILNGAGLQMLIYLFALKEFGGSYYGHEKLIPAGVLYLPARKDYSLTRPQPEDDEVEEFHQEERRRKGLIRQEDHLLQAMEADAENPRYMPYKVGKSGPEGNLADGYQMDLLERHILRTLSGMADAIASGTVSPNPIIRGSNTSCRYCDFKDVCHMDLCMHEQRIMSATNAKRFWEKLEEGDRRNG